MPWEAIMKKIMILSLILISGCSSLSPYFITVSRDHRVVTTETNAAIIGTLRDECESETDLVKIKACEDLIKRLQVISRQSVAIEEYVMNKATEEDLAHYIRTKWRASQ